MTDTLIIAGAGPSGWQYDWASEKRPVMAISAGITAVGHAEHFVSLDKPMHFPRWVAHGDWFIKHVAVNKHFGEWSKHPLVQGWAYTGGDWPDFDSESHAPLVIGPLPRNHSLLFGVQVAARLGYKRMLFIGVDLLEREHDDINKIMAGWWTKANDVGIEWVNGSGISALREWMPMAPEPELVPL